jgi:mannose-6-phosphate isomerase-like protein (cupin superfamily)
MNDEVVILKKIRNLQQIKKVWGCEEQIENNDKYSCKLLHINSGYQSSLHYHMKKDETFILQKGRILLEIGDSVHEMQPGDYIRIQPQTRHRFKALEDSVILEVGTTHYENDSYRLESSRQC